MKTATPLFFLALILLLSMGRVYGQTSPEFTYTVTSGSTTQFIAPNATTTPVMVRVGTTPNSTTTYPINNTVGWNTITLPVGWTLTDTPAPAYIWENASTTVNITLAIDVPNTAGPGSYTFTLNLTPGKDAAGATIAPGAGVFFNITVDSTPPVITPTVTPSPNSNGWNNGTVNVTWSVSDSQSGISSSSGCAPASLSSETLGTVITCTATNGAGLTGTDSVTIRIDLAAPTISASHGPGPNTFGWNNANVTVTFTCSDVLSGLASISGNTTLSTQGANQSVTGTCTDRAGNTAQETVSGINIDKTPPTIALTGRTPANGFGWNNNTVTVTWSCADALSGPVSLSTSQTIASEGTNQTAIGTCHDLAGNTASDQQIGINVDKTPPTISGSRTPSPNVFGWNNVNVTVTFNCSDTLSGLESSSGPTTLSAEGANQSVTGTCTDRAGNTANSTVSGINIDKTPPTISGTRTPGPNVNGWNNANVTVSFTCNDALSGINDTSAPTVLYQEAAGQSVTGACSDKAGNSASSSVTGINIDKTLPVISGTRSPPANTAGWNNGNVTVTFSCTDSLSGVDVFSGPATLYLDGANQSATGSCSDKAGNSASATVGGVNIDKSPPTLTPTPSPAPNIYNWNNGNVTVNFQCSDSLSGVATSSPAVTLYLDGKNQSAGGSCTDKAGNTITATITGINIDKTPPAISPTGRTPTPNANGWNNNNVTLTWSCGDTLSGPLRPSASQTVSTEGTNQTATGTCQDLAGNTATNIQTNINIDKTPPTINVARNPVANSFGWSNANVTVSFTCADTLSGLALGSPPASIVLSGEGANQSASGACTDLAGNTASATMNGISIDKTPPSITGSASPAPNPLGWNNQNVTVSFMCTDSLSGVDSTSGPTVLSSDGVNQSVSGTCTDRAGNTASTAVSGIKIDKTPPAITGSRTPSPNINGWNNVTVAVNFSCSDSLSGLASATGNATLATEGGNQSATGICSDKAGNSASETISGINIDKTPPTLTGIRNPPPNIYGWNNVNVIVTFNCADSVSGVQSVTSPATFTAELANQTTTGSCIDLAGNSVSVTVSGISIDETPPVAALVSRSPANSFGWNANNVTLTWTCSDALSGPIATNMNQIVSTEGANQTVTSTCEDHAGNTAVNTQSGINIDKTPPTIIGVQNPALNPSGWSNTNVTVNFTCSDALSGLAAGSPPASTVLYSEGIGQSVTGSCSDLAGNTASATVGNINIDKTSPNIVGSRSPGPNALGWNNQNVTVSFSCTDSLSGVGVLSPPTILSSDGVNQSVTGSCSDQAGNTVTTTISGVDIDRTPPSMTGSRSPGPDANGWNNVNITVTFLCSDSLSGLDSFSGNATLSAEGFNQSVAGTCSDRAGNTATDILSGISIDKTPPNITNIRNPPPNVYGWNNVNVTVTFSCTDTLSGVQSVTGPTTFSGEGPNQSMTGDCFDLAGNSAGITVSGINIDKTPPTTSFLSRTAPNSFGWNNATVILNWSCADTLSGPQATTTSTSLTTEGVNQSAIGTCYDRAGNAASNTQSGMNIDKTPPLAQIILTPATPDGANGWYRTSVTVQFSCSDALSGLDPATNCPAGTTVTFDGIYNFTTGIIRDRAGNTAISSATVKLETSAPSLILTPNRAPDFNGWYNHTVSFQVNSSSSASGALTCVPVAPYSGPDSFNASIVTTCTDAAGNSVSAGFSFKYDGTPPTVLILSPVNGYYYPRETTLSASYLCSDSFSGLVSCTGIVANGTRLDTIHVGPVIFYVQAKDQAGNSFTKWIYYWIIPSKASFPAYATVLTLSLGVALTAIRSKRKSKGPASRSELLFGKVR